MKVLVVCSGNSGRASPFIEAQIKSIKQFEVEFKFFLIKGKGIIGYLKNYPKLLRVVRKGKYDLIHAHYGLSGLLAVLQKSLPVIITFHGSDINVKSNQTFSLLASKLSTFNIFVHASLPDKVFAKNKYVIIPCGVDLDTFCPLNKAQCRNKLGWELNKYIGVFSGAFDNKVKNYRLAQKATNLTKRKVGLIELKAFSQEEVNLLLNSADFLLVTSFSETGPLVVKEAMACNCPIVSTDVGDVRDVIGNTEGCYISSYDPEDVAGKIKKALEFGKRTDGRDRINQYDLKIIAKRIYEVFEKITSNTKEKNIFSDIKN